MRQLTQLQERLRRARPFRPFAFPLLPLIDGLARHVLRRQGVVMETHRLNHIAVNLYRAAGRAAPAQELPVLLVHGIADGATTWSLLIRSLTDIGPVYAVDLPGFGLSGYPPGRRFASFHEHLTVLQELIRTVIGRPALVVGNSLGGWLAAELALASPELVPGIVMLNPGGALLGGQADWEDFVATASVRDLRTVRQIYRQMFGTALRLPLYLDQVDFQALFRRDPVTQFIANATEAEFLTAEDLRQLCAPVGLIWGLADRFLPPGSLEFFRHHLPSPALLLLPGCGHLPQRERPLEVLRFLHDFAAQRVRPALVRTP